MNIYLPANDLRECAEITQPFVGEQLDTIQLVLGVGMDAPDCPMPRNCRFLAGWVANGIHEYGRFLYEYGLELGRAYKRRTQRDHPSYTALHRAYRFLLLERINVPSIINSVLFIEQQRGRLLHEGDKYALMRRARKWLGRKASIGDWLYQEIGSHGWSELDMRCVSHLNSILDHKGVRTYDNWFDNYGWRVRRCCDNFTPSDAEMEFCISRQGESRIHRASNEWVFTLSD